MNDSESNDQDSDPAEKASGLPVAQLELDDRPQGYPAPRELLEHLVKEPPHPVTHPNSALMWSNRLRELVADMRTNYDMSPSEPAAPCTLDDLLDAQQALGVLRTEALGARNALARELERIDGEHSSSLTDCAERAAKLLADGPVGIVRRCETLGTILGEMVRQAERHDLGNLDDEFERVVSTAREALAASTSPTPRPAASASSSTHSPRWSSSWSCLPR